MNKETVSEEQVLFNKLKYDDKVLIINFMKTLQPEEKKIPEKLYEISNIGDLTITYPNNEQLMNKINEIIDYLKSKGE